MWWHRKSEPLNPTPEAQPDPVLFPMFSQRPQAHGCVDTAPPGLSTNTSRQPPLAQPSLVAWPALGASRLCRLCKQAQSCLDKKFWDPSYLPLCRFKTGTQALGGHASCLAISSHRKGLWVQGDQSRPFEAWFLSQRLLFWESIGVLHKHLWDYFYTTESSKPVGKDGSIQQTLLG